MGVGMFGPEFAIAVAELVLVAAILAAANVREQTRPTVGVHGLRWIVRHGLWQPAGTPSLDRWLTRIGLLYGVTYPILSLMSGIALLPARLPTLLSAGFVVLVGAIGAAAVLGAPWWWSELLAGPDGVRVSGRWPRAPVALQWSAIQAIRVVGRDLVFEGPDDLVVLSMSWGPRALLAEVATQLEATRLSASPSTPEALPPPPPELDALMVSARAGTEEPDLL